MEIIYEAGRTPWFWYADQTDEVHGTLEITMDHVIDGKKLAAAWEITKKVYPLMDTTVMCVGEDKRFVFCRAEGDNHPVHSSRHMKPGSTACAGRPVAVSYDENTISITILHSVLDGHGLMEIGKNLSFHYLELYAGNAGEKPAFIREEGMEISDYYQPEALLKIGSYVPQPVVTVPPEEKMYVDPAMTDGEAGRGMSAKIRIPVADFITKCKEKGANPSSMFTYLLGTAIRQVNSLEKESLSFSVTVDMRKAYGIDSSLAACSGDALVTLNQEDLTSAPVRQTIHKIREAIDYQRSDDYIKTYEALCRTYMPLFRRNVCAVVSYVGKFTIGSNDEHIKDVAIYNGMSNTMLITQLEDQFQILVRFGGATEKYARKLMELLSKMDLQPQIYADVYQTRTETDQV